MDDFPGDEVPLRRIGRALWTELTRGGGTILVDGDQFLELDPVALRIWTLLTEPVSVDGIVDVLTQEYDVSPDDCRQGVRATVTMLWSHGQLEVP